MFVNFLQQRHPTEKAYYIAKELLMTERTYKKDLEVIDLVWYKFLEVSLRFFEIPCALKHDIVTVNVVWCIVVSRWTRQRGVHAGRSLGVTFQPHRSYLWASYSSSQGNRTPSCSMVWISFIFKHAQYVIVISTPLYREGRTNSYTKGDTQKIGDLLLKMTSKVEVYLKC